MWTDDLSDDEVCEVCWGRGFETDCPDDLCQGEEGCIHGDNFMCLDCGGTGYIRYISEEEADFLLEDILKEKNEERER